MGRGKAGGGGSRHSNEDNDDTFRPLHSRGLDAAEICYLSDVSFERHFVVERRFAVSAGPVVCAVRAAKLGGAVIFLVVGELIVRSETVFALFTFGDHLAGCGPRRV